MMKQKKKDIRTTKDKKGWLIPYLTALDQMFYKRWSYWTEAVMKDQIPKEPIPEINFQMPMVYKEQLVKKNLKECLDRASYRYSNAFEKFIDWILWGFNQGKESPAIDDKLDDFWYRTFNLGLFYKEPADHLADLATEYNGSFGGYFPTPANIVQLMTTMTLGDEPSHKHKKMSVCDPCSGSGIMLLYASNYSLNLYGQDISALMCKVATVNAFIYVPWLAYRPKHLTMFDRCDEAIVEIELPTGIRVPECTHCNGRDFMMELETDHKVTAGNGLLTVDQPTLSMDLVSKKLKPQNISCSHCYERRTNDTIMP